MSEKLMGPSVVIIGFEKDCSNQIRRLLQHSDTLSTIRIIDEAVSTSEDCWSDNDIALINSYNGNYPHWVKNCLHKTEGNPPASLIVGDFQETHGEMQNDRRATPRLYLSDSHLTANNLLDAIHRLDSAKYLAPENKDNRESSSAKIVKRNSSQYDAEPSSTASTEPFSDKALEQGDIFVGHYQLTRLLGIGGTATVYEAKSADQQTLAIKLLDPSTLNDYRFLGRFIEEYKLLSSIEHTNIVKVYEQGFTTDHIYIVMQRLNIESLGHRICRGLTTGDAVKYAIDISHALSTIHQHGILHRDLKPGNILFDENDRPVITDFGIAKGTGEHKSPDVTMIGETLGTPAYMSPEQVLGHQLTTSSDLYAFGIVFYRMLTGKLPFEAKNSIGLMRKHIESTPPHLPTELKMLDPVVQRLLSKQPTRRYQSAQELQDDLLEFVFLW